jgi:hypothetical protein
MDTRHDLAENGIFKVTQLDADRMHATPATFGFLPIVLAHKAPPESCTKDRNISVLHPSFPCIEPTCFGNADVDRWPAVIFLNEFGVHRILLLTPEELLVAYDIPVPMQDAYACAGALQCNVSFRLASCVPSRTAHMLAEPILDFLLGDRQDPEDMNPVLRLVSALITSGMPTQDERAQAYVNDPDFKFMMTHLSGEWSAAKVKKVHACYRQPLLQGYIDMVNTRLCITHLVDGHTHLLLLVIVPTSLRRLMFTAYHASPVCGHMGRYKTLFRLRQRFFWPSMRKFVEDLVGACLHCALDNSRKRNKSEIMFGWPLDSPFCTLHADLFFMGEVEGDRLQEHVMNTMCDMTQFVITTPFPDTATHVLAPIFMQEVLLKVGFCVMVVVDDGSTFKGLFVEMCKILKLRCHVVARNNHQALCVERFHVFLNKTLRIATNDRDSIKGIYIPASALAAFAWNSAPIDGTDIVHSVPAVGREFMFPFDFEYIQSPTMS